MKHVTLYVHLSRVLCRGKNILHPHESYPLVWAWLTCVISYLSHFDMIGGSRWHHGFVPPGNFVRVFTLGGIVCGAIFMNHVFCVVSDGAGAPARPECSGVCIEGSRLATWWHRSLQDIWFAHRKGYSGCLRNGLGHHADRLSNRMRERVLIYQRI